LLGTTFIERKKERKRKGKNIISSLIAAEIILFRGASRGETDRKLEPR
jgi:hypothetical protein